METPIIDTISPFGNISDVEHDNEALVIDKDYDRVSDLVKVGDVFVFITPVDNPETSTL